MKEISQEGKRYFELAKDNSKKMESIFGELEKDLEELFMSKHNEHVFLQDEHTK